MTIQEKCIHLVTILGYNSRQLGNVLEVSQQTADKKIKLIERNKFTEKDFEKLCQFIDNLNLEIIKLKLL